MAWERFHRNPGVEMKCCAGVAEVYVLQPDGCEGSEIVMCTLHDFPVTVENALDVLRRLPRCE